MWFAVILGHSCFDKKYQKLKRKGSSGQYRKAVRIFNSRKVKAIKEGEDIFVDEHISKQSFTPTTNNGKTRPAVVQFPEWSPMKDR